MKATKAARRRKFSYSQSKGEKLPVDAEKNGRLKRLTDYLEASRSLFQTQMKLTEVDSFSHFGAMVGPSKAFS